jgi:putative cell wall-binding protein
VSGMRFDDADRVGAAAVTTTSRQLATHAVLARDDAFADALSGASLTMTAPLLLTPAGHLSPAVADELQRTLPSGAVVHLLGGEAALSADVADAVAALGLVPNRLAGPTRVETSIAVADAVMTSSDTDQVVLARADGPADNPTSAWADAISAGAHGARTATPVLLTPTAALHPAVAGWLHGQDLDPVLVGGTAALSDAVADALPGSRRIAGPDRASTAAAVATGLWGGSGPLTSATAINGWHVDGWAFGLVGAGLAADLRAPLLLVGDTVPAATASLLDCTAVTVLGDATTVTKTVRDQLAACSTTEG